MTEFPARTEVVDYLKTVLYGPQGGAVETIAGTPFLRYMTGMLFPAQQEVSDGEKAVTATADDDLAGAELGDEEGEVESGLELAFEMLQAAVGLSFRASDSATVRCKVWAARYEKVPRPEDDGSKGSAKTSGRSSQSWRRVPIATESNPEVVAVTRESGPIAVLGGRAQVLTRWRSIGDGTAVITISLVNQQLAAKRGGLDPALALFQVGMRCEVDEGGIMPYPEVGTDHEPGSEEAEVAFLYKGCHPFARGHGAAATWGGVGGDRCRWVAIDFIPTADVPAATFELRDTGVDPRCTDISFLCKSPRAQVIEVLRTLPAAYSVWIEKQRRASVPVEFLDTANEFIGRAEKWLERMGRGLVLLEDANDDSAWRAFQIANRAMAMQMIFSREAKDGPYPLNARRELPQLDFTGLSWRPFQVAFMLATIESVWRQQSIDREVVDVIWFPTGGGKTEAYLFVSALELVRRRLVHGDHDNATAVMSRYTLRMLTAQQFQRSAALIIALELIRRENEALLGKRPFSLGLWVGKGLTDNTVRKAHKRLQEILKSARPENPFQLQACPCCATEIFPARPTGHAGRWNMAEFGVRSTEGSFSFYCPNDRCKFHDHIPLQVIDDELYVNPPSMLLGTLDKFAQLPWDARSRAFFGGTDDVSPPPSLILQDELHLISGPLGSISAPYEAAIETVIRLRGGNPKRIASTATIRNAREQVRGLYGGRKAAVFPSPCGSWDDAFFFSIDKTKPGRKYVGLMGQGYTKPVVAMTWTAAAMLQATQEVKLDPCVLDAYWTVLVYHNSRRELGRTLTAARDEIETRIKVIASDSRAPRELGEPMELSAQMVKSMSEALEALGRKHATSRPAVDLVPCTSIVSVGVDIDRLGIMMVNGQPKLTSEYIQATSRVGRAKVPGLVVTLFSPSKPRDRSHYEDFRAYHESIYRHVEPTSVTPYALPSRLRTFHAALVALIRHGLGWSRVEEAGKVDFDDPRTQEAVDQMLKLMCAADPAEASELRKLASQRIQEWKDFAEANVPLHYENRQSGMAFSALLYQFGSPPNRAQWATMNSVRNVDFETLISVQ